MPGGVFELEIAVVLHNLGAVITLGLGGMALIRPRLAASFTSIEPVGLLGLSEIRATYGGLFAALGAVALFLQDNIFFAGLGAGWLGAAMGRSLSVFLDHSRENKNFGGIAFESVLGILLLAPF